ncbi:MAG: hypothetical protein NZ482_01935 [Gloeomargarita sp. SKYG98]|nr:hypothetical protein [Gloeomargarita sp. SKYG98]
MQDVFDSDLEPGVTRETWERLERLVERGFLRYRPSLKQAEILGFASYVLDELERTGEAPVPGESLESLEIWGTFECFYRWSAGVLWVDELDEFVRIGGALVRLYLNGVLVGLSVCGELMVDRYKAYSEWLSEFLGKGTVFEV